MSEFELPIAHLLLGIRSPFSTGNLLPAANTYSSKLKVKYTRYSFPRGFNGSIYTLMPLVSIQVLCYGKYIFNLWPSAHSVEDGALHLTAQCVESVRVGDSYIVCVKSTPCLGQ